MSSQDVYVSYLNTVSNQIAFYGLWMILPVSVVGNLISLYIYTRPNLNKKTNTGILYGWLSLLNAIAICYYCLVFRGNLLIQYTYNFPCGLNNYLVRIGLYSITWMQAVISLDRFIAVFLPTKTALMTKKVVIYSIMLCFLAFILIINVTNLITYSVTDANNITSCFTSNGVSIATSINTNLTRVFIPFVFMLTLNLLVIWRLKSSKIRVGVVNVLQIATASQQNGQYHKQMTNREFRFTISTLLIDFVFLFCYFPLEVNIGIQLYNLFGDSITGSPIASAVLNVFTSVAQVMALGHTAVLFFVFVIFNRNFRNELVMLFRLYKIFPALQPPDNNTMLTRIMNNNSQIYIQ